MNERPDLDHANEKVSFLNVRRRQCPAEARERGREPIMQESPAARQAAGGTGSGYRSS